VLDREGCREYESVLDRKGCREYDSVLDREGCREYDSVLDREGCRAYNSVLDREGVSVLERMRRRVCQYSDSKYRHDRDYIAPEYKKLPCEIKKYVRRHSV
jgi:hypothetical protein